MSSIVYTRYELVRTLRNTRFLLVSIAFPVILFVLVAGQNKNATLDGVPFPTYYMTGMVAWGTMGAVVAGGIRIAAERSFGWNRQLRVSPLSVGTYLAAKVVTSYLMALVSMAVLYIVGTIFGVRLSVGHWLVLSGLILIGLVPFAVLGILLGHAVRADAAAPALGGITALFALLGGAWGPLADHGTLLHIVQWIPSYWLVQAAKSALNNTGWPGQAWLVVAVWTAVLTVLARKAYQRDTQRQA